MSVDPPVITLSPASLPGALPSLRTRGAFLRGLDSFAEPRGTLVCAQAETPIPFTPRRLWFVFGVPAGQSRGGHGHRSLQEFIVCQRGACTVAIDDGISRDEVRLDRPDVGLYVQALTWSTLRDFSPDALLLVAASELYRPEDYIRDYDEFLSLVAQRDRGWPRAAG